MSMKNYAAAVGTRGLPQASKIPGSTQVKNDAGGYSWVADEFTALRRFLVLGAIGGTYYVGESVSIERAASTVRACLDSDWAKTLDMAQDVSVRGAGPSNDPPIMVLALALRHSDVNCRREAVKRVPAICRTFTHLASLATMIKATGGWGTLARAAVSAWYAAMKPDRLAYQAVKYWNRLGWSQRDLVRISHPKVSDPALNSVLGWIARGDGGELPPIIGAADAIKHPELTAAGVVELIEDHNLPWEAVPTNWRRDIGVRTALLYRMPLMAMIRQLGVLTELGVLDHGKPTVDHVVAKLTDQDEISKSRVHPLHILQALLVYKSGGGRRGSKTWSPIRQVVDALDRAFYLSFDNVEPTGKRILLALDCSGSMGWAGGVGGVEGFTPMQAAAAMGMVMAAVEPAIEIISFDTSAKSVSISPRQRLDDVVAEINRRGGGTDCSLPFRWGLDHGRQYDAIVVITDGESWAGRHPATVLAEYRNKINPATRMVWVMTTAGGRTLRNVDSGDPLSLDIAGFDPNVPAVISEFIS